MLDQELGLLPVQLGRLSRRCWVVAEPLHTLGSSALNLCPVSSNARELLPGEGFQLVSGNGEASFWDGSLLCMLARHKHTQRPGKAASAYSATLWLIQLVLLMDALALRARDNSSTCSI